MKTWCNVGCRNFDQGNFAQEDSQRYEDRYGRQTIIKDVAVVIKSYSRKAISNVSGNRKQIDDYHIVAEGLKRKGNEEI